MRRQIEDLLMGQAAIAASVVTDTGKAPTGSDGVRKAIEDWAAKRADAANLVRKTLDEVEAADGGWTFAKLTIVGGALRELSGP